MQRGSAVDVVELYVGAVTDQEEHRVDVSVLDRQHQ